MQLQKLTLTNFRAFKQAEFEFKPGMNLIVGINGVGKSSVLDAIRVMLSRVMPQISGTRNQPLYFSGDDISVNEEALSVSLEFLLGKTLMSGLGFLPREKYSSTDTVGDVRDQAYELSNRYEFKPDPRRVNLANSDKYGEPLVVFFSTSRSVSNRSSAGRNKSNSPNSDALAERGLGIREFAEWWLVQQALMRETNQPIFGHHMEILSETISSFLDSVGNLRATRGDKPTLIVEKYGKRFDVAQLSDGERGMLALVFDLARRLAQANPKLSDPLKNGQAIVLIDELDLHLHPRWQREIVQKLTDTFQKCQFIVTTHSPQIVGEVSPDNIIILEEGRPPYRPDQALGMDTNWILEFLMGTNSRNPEFEKKLNQISDLIEDNEFEKAQTEIDALKNSNLARDPELVKLQARLTRFQILKDDQEEN